MEDYLKIYTIDELSDLKKGAMSVFSGGPKGVSVEHVNRNPDGSYTKEPSKTWGKHGRGPDVKKRKKKGMSGGGRNWQVSGSGVKEEKPPKGYKPPYIPEQKTSWSGKSLGDCYTIDELYELKKGKVSKKGDAEKEKGYIGFKKLEGKLSEKGAKSPGGLARWIGERKYGKKKFESSSKKGKKMRNIKAKKG